jgi:hypothetical protein
MHVISPRCLLKVACTKHTGQSASHHSDRCVLLSLYYRGPAFVKSTSGEPQPYLFQFCAAWPDNICTPV